MAKGVKWLVAFFMRTFFFVIILVLGGCGSKTTQHDDVPVNAYGNPGYIISFHPPQYICYRTSETITIDGRADEAAWQKLPWNINFVDILGYHFPKPDYLTRGKMLWDHEYVFIAAEMQEPHLRALLSDGRLDDENSFVVMIDVDGDTHQYQEMTVNTNGTARIQTISKPHGSTELWSKGKSSQIGIMVHCEGTLNDPTDEDNYWSLEAAFPISLLTEGADSFIPRNGVQWRVNFARTYWNALVVDGYYKKEINSESGTFYPSENWVWSPMGHFDLHMPELWSFVQFSEMEAGLERDKFVYNNDEDVKWELRNIYYAQQRYFETNGRYAKRLGQLKEVGFVPDALRFKSHVEGDESAYVAKAQSPDKKSVWKLNQEGRIWMETVVSAK